MSITINPMLGDVKRNDVERELVLEAIWRLSGYDFRNYAIASLSRRLEVIRVNMQCATLSELIPKIVQDPRCVDQILKDLSVPVTEFFRDPDFYQCLRTKVFKALKTYSFFKIWHAGCATGEEVYSVAALLAEDRLLKQAQIYATDFNGTLLSQAKNGIYDGSRIKLGLDNLRKIDAGIQFKKYYKQSMDHLEECQINPDLRDKITFANHNLVTDGGFGEMQIIICRNVLIYFNAVLQEHVLKLFDASLSIGGYLCLGNKETLEFSSLKKKYQVISPEQRIYRKKLNVEPDDTIAKSKS